MNNLAGGLIYTKYKSMFGSDFEMVKIKSFSKSLSNMH